MKKLLSNLALAMLVMVPTSAMAAQVTLDLIPFRHFFNDRQGVYNITFATSSRSMSIVENTPLNNDKTILLYTDGNGNYTVAPATPGDVIMAPAESCILFQGARCSSITFDNFNTSNVTTMESMFKGCSNLTSLDLSSFNTANVTDMSSMFEGCSQLEYLNLLSFNTAKVTTMASMFKGVSKCYGISLASFNTSNVTDMSSMFENCDYLIAIEVQTFDTQKVTNSENMFNGCSYTLKGYSGRFNENFPTDKTYAHCNSGGYLTLVSFDKDMLQQRLANLKSSDYTLTFLKSASSIPDTDLTYNVNNPGSVKLYIVGNKCYVAPSIDVESFWLPQDCHNLFNDCKSISTIDLSALNSSKVNYMSQMFYGCSNLKTVNLTNISTEKVRDMTSMFSGCSNLQSLDLSGFRLSGFTANGMLNCLDGMFHNCSSLTSLDLSSFDTKYLKSAQSMFKDCTQLEVLTIGNFSMQNVDNADDMFSGCTNLNTLILKTIPDLKDGTFNTQFSGEGKSVIYQPGDNSTQIALAPTYTRPIAAESNLGTLVLPYQISSNDDVQLYKFISVKDNELCFRKVATVEANTPCLFMKKNETATSVAFTADDNTLSFDVPATPDAVDGFAIRGTYTNLTDQEDIYYIAQNKFWWAEQPISIDPFRAWFEGTEPMSSAKSVNILFDEDGETNQIGEIRDDSIRFDDDSTYNLNGQRVNANTKGIVIKNGRKILNK